jgi:SET domain-containing protein
MMLVRCYLAPSRIEGLGVFCKEVISKGQNIWRRDRMLDVTLPMDKLDQVEPHVKEFLERYALPDINRPGYMLLEGDEGRFLNHAEWPNLDFSDGLRGIALADIPAGTELTRNYADFMTGEIRMQPPRHQLDVLSTATH